MQKSAQLIFIAVLLNLHFCKVISDEPREDQTPNYEYIQIYQHMPALFEYLLNALEERPEMLETNDITMFKGNSDDRSKRSIPYADYCDVNKYELNADDCSSTRNIDTRGINDEFKQAECTLANEYNNNFITNSHAESCKINEKREAALDDSKDLADDKSAKKTKQKRKVNKNHDSAWNSEDGYPGFQGLLKLDVEPKEIEQGFLLSEKLLEDFNSNKHK